MSKIFVVIALTTSLLGSGWKRVIGSSDAPLLPSKEVIKSDE
jgi:hypothetical protein